MPATINDQVDIVDVKTQIKTILELGSAADADVSDFATAAQGTKADNAIPNSKIGAVNGVAPLDGAGKVDAQYLPVDGSFAGIWNATTNTPTIVSGSGISGQYYIVSVAGTTEIDGEDTWGAGDQIRFNGSVWQRIPTYQAVSTVNGKVGTVVLTASDIPDLGDAATKDVSEIVSEVEAALPTPTPFNLVGNGTSGPYNLGVTVQNYSAIILNIDGVTQIGGVDFTYSGSNITFTELVPTAQQTIHGYVFTATSVDEVAISALDPKPTAPTYNSLVAIGETGENNKRAIVASLFEPGGFMSFPTVEAAVGYNIPTNITHVCINNINYLHNSDEPDAPSVAKIELDNGNWLLVNEPYPHARHFNIPADGSDVTTALNEARLYAYKYGDMKLRLGVGKYGVSDTLFVGTGGDGIESGYQNCSLVGCGHAYLNSPKSSTIIEWVGADDANKTVLEVNGRISGVEIGGFMIDCKKKVRDGLKLKSVYGGNVHDIWVKDFRRDGITVTTHGSPAATAYSSFNRFMGLISTSLHVETSGNYETCAWRISGSDVVAGAWGNTYIGCRGSVYRDATNTAWPRVIHLAYTDSSTFIECDFTLAWSGIDAGGNVIPGTPGSPAAARGYGAVYDASVKDQFPLNVMFYGCSIVGNTLVIETPGVNEIGSVLYVNQPTRDWEGAPTHPKIRGFNDRGYYFGDTPIAIRGDGNKLRFYQQNLERYVDFIMNSSGVGFIEFLMQYHNAAGENIPALGINASGEIVVHQGLRGEQFTIAVNDVAIYTPRIPHGTISMTNVGFGVDRSCIFSYRTIGTHQIALQSTVGNFPFKSNR